MDDFGRHGEQHGAHKLTEDEVKQIRAMLAQKVSQVRIAAQFGVRQTTISAIKRKQLWGWLPDAPDV